MKLGIEESQILQSDVCKEQNAYDFKAKKEIFQQQEVYEHVQSDNLLLQAEGLLLKV